MVHGREKNQWLTPLIGQCMRGFTAIRKMSCTPSPTFEEHMNETRQTRTAQVVNRLEAAGVQLETLPSGATRLYGLHGEVITTSDLLNLRQHEMDRICHA